MYFYWLNKKKVFSENLLKVDFLNFEISVHSMKNFPRVYQNSEIRLIKNPEILEVCKIVFQYGQSQGSPVTYCMVKSLLFRKKWRTQSLDLKRGPWNTYIIKSLKIIRKIKWPWIWFPKKHSKKCNKLYNKEFAFTSQFNLNEMEKVKDLGVIMSSDCTFIKARINKISQRKWLRGSYEHSKQEKTNQCNIIQTIG